MKAEKIVQRNGTHDTNTGDPNWMSAPHGPIQSSSPGYSQNSNNKN